LWEIVLGSVWRCLGKGIVPEEENVCEKLPGKCPDPHAGLQDFTYPAVVICATLVNTHTHTHTHANKQPSTGYITVLAQPAELITRHVAIRAALPHCQLRAPVPPVIRGFNHEASCGTHLALTYKILANPAMLG